MGSHGSDRRIRQMNAAGDPAHAAGAYIASANSGAKSPSFVRARAPNLIRSQIRHQTGIQTMPAVGGDGLEKLEDMIVRAAELSADHVRAAKAAIGTVIFGQDKVIEQALVTILSG